MNFFKPNCKSNKKNVRFHNIVETFILSFLYEFIATKNGI